MSTRKFLLILVLVVSLALVSAGCSKVATAGGGPQAGTVSLQASGEAMPRTINVNGIGMASARPDVTFVQLGVESIDTEAGQAVDDNTTRMSAVMDVLKEMNVQEEDIQTLNYSMWIEQVVDRDGQPTGENRYHVINQVRIHLRDLTQTGELLQQALAAGANNVGGISFTVSDPAALQREARDKAIANARAKAEQLAAGLNAQLGSMRQASEYSGMLTPFAEAPMMAEGIGGGGGPVPVSSGGFNVTVEIQVTFEIAE